MHNDGAKLVGVVERDGSLYNKDGINPDELKAYITKTGGVIGFPSATVYKDDSVFYTECDILIPAA